MYIQNFAFDAIVDKKVELYRKEIGDFPLLWLVWGIVLPTGVAFVFSTTLEGCGVWYSSVGG